MKVQIASTAGLEIDMIFGTIVGLIKLMLIGLFIFVMFWIFGNFDGDGEVIGYQPKHSYSGVHTPFPKMTISLMDCQNIRSAKANAGIVVVCREVRSAD